MKDSRGFNVTARRKLTNDNSAPSVIKATAFQAVTFYDETLKRQIIVLYSLGSDGIIREYIGGKWNPYPINP